MKYKADIDRKNPTCFVFLIDQSGSMSEKFAGTTGGQSKAEALAYQLNNLLAELIIKCSKPEIRDYFHVEVIGYGLEVQSVFGGLLPVSEIEPLARQERVTNPVTGLTVQSPVWFEAVADGNTPMCEALERARFLVEEWVGAHPTCFPPIVINLTDGIATDGNPVENARRIMGVECADGAVLLFNCHLSSIAGCAIEFPGAETELPADPFAHNLFSMSSVIPDAMRASAAHASIRIDSGARGMVFSSDLNALVTMLEMGTTQANN